MIEELARQVVQEVKASVALAVERSGTSWES
jgi:hypothetical protein